MDFEPRKVKVKTIQAFCLEEFDNAIEAMHNKIIYQNMTFICIGYAVTIGPKGQLTYTATFKFYE